MNEMVEMFDIVSPSDVAIVPTLSSPFAGIPPQASSSWHIEKKQYVDMHYILQVLSDYVTDHYMVCSGVCSEMRGILRISGASNRSLEFSKLVSVLVGHLHSLSTLASASPAYDLGVTSSTQSEQLHHILKRPVATNVWERAEPFHVQFKSRPKDDYFCTTFQMYINIPNPVCIGGTIVSSQ